jgi:predicted dehydrogenase
VQTTIDPQQDSKEVDKFEKDTPEHVMIQGRFKSGAIFNYNLRGGMPFAGADGLIWTIYGEKGEIRVTSPSSLIDIDHEGIKIQLHIFGEKEPQTLELAQDEMEKLPDPQQSVGRIYLAYLEGNEGDMAGYPTWETGFKVHELIEDMYNRSAGFTYFGEPVKPL